MNQKPAPLGQAFAVPEPVLTLMEAFREEGFECFAVGGCVRDSLLGREPQDWDLTTEATVKEMAEIFSARSIRWIETGKEHGTLTALTKSGPIEITTYRIDGTYADGRHPDSVKFTRSLAEDLSRRDFTINAMAWSPETGVVDQFCGEQDLAAKLIRTVGNAHERFSEDALRIWRALRFAAQLGFRIEGEKEAGTSLALREDASLVAHLSRERIFTELTKLLSAPNKELVSAILGSYPEVFLASVPQFPSLDVLRNNLSALGSLPSDASLGLLYSVLFFGSGLDALRSLKPPKTLLKTVDSIWKLQDALQNVEPLGDPASVRHFLVAAGSLDRACEALDFHRAFAHVTLGYQELSYESLLQKLREESESGLPLTMKELAINGTDLLALGFEPGVAIGNVLGALFHDVIEGGLPNQREALLDRAQVMLGDA